MMSLWAKIQTISMIFWFILVLFIMWIIMKDRGLKKGEEPDD